MFIIFIDLDLIWLRMWQNSCLRTGQLHYIMNGSLFSDTRPRWISLEEQTFKKSLKRWPKQPEKENSFLKKNTISSELKFLRKSQKLLRYGEKLFRIFIKQNFRMEHLTLFVRIWTTYQCIIFLTRNSNKILSWKELRIHKINKSIFVMIVDFDIHYYSSYIIWTLIIYLLLITFEKYIFSKMWIFRGSIFYHKFYLEAFGLTNFWSGESIFFLRNWDEWNILDLRNFCELFLKGW